MHYQPFIEALIRLSAAVIIGGVLGFERHLHGRWAGLRTHMTVALASAVMQGIAAGIGFLGAGTILKLSDRLEIKGLTTASSIWLTAALGTVVRWARAWRRSLPERCRVTGCAASA